LRLGLPRGFGVWVLETTRGRCPRTRTRTFCREKEEAFFEDSGREIKETGW